jgi:hypothetical protein
MTVSNSANKITYIGNGTTIQFPFTFKIFKTTDMQVILTDISTGVDTMLAPNSNYSVNLTTSYVTYPVSGSPLTSATKITLNRSVPITQETSLPNQGAYFAKTVETALDKITIIEQQQQEQLSRSLLQSVLVDSDVSNILPAPVPNQALGWNETGTKLINITPGTFSLSDYTATAKLSDIITTNPWVDVRAFGAKGDGITDDAVSIQNAINYAKTNKISKVTVPSGKTYAISATIRIPSNIDFVGEIGSEGSYNYLIPELLPTVANLNVLEVWDNGGKCIRGINIQNIAIINSRNLVGINGIYCNLVDKDYYIEFCSFKNVWVHQCNNGLYFEGTGYSGFCSLTFEAFNATFNNIGLQIKGISDGTNTPWFNVATFNRCTFNNNKVGGVLYDGLQSHQTHNFNNCRLETNGQEGLFSGVTAEAYAFKATGSGIGPIEFNGCYFENNIPTRTATTTETTNFNTNGITTPYGKSLNNEELIGTTIYPLAIDKTKAGDILLNFASAISVKNCEIAPAVNFMSLTVGTVDISNNQLAIITHTQIRSCQSKNLVTILNASAAWQSEEIIISLKNNAFAYDSGVFTNYLTSSVGMANDSRTREIALDGQLDPTKPLSLLRYSPSENYGYNTLYVDPINGNDDTGLGILASNPWASLHRAMQFISVSKETDFCIDLSSGTTYSVSSLLTIKNKNITIQGDSATVQTIMPTQYLGTGFLYYMFYNCNITFKNVNLSMQATLTGSFDWNVWFRLAGVCNIIFNAVDFSANNNNGIMFFPIDSAASEIKLNLINCTNSSGLANLILKSTTTTVDSIGRINGWTMETTCGTTSQRPNTARCAIGDKYYDTTFNKPIWYNGTNWKDATGATV